MQKYIEYFNLDCLPWRAKGKKKGKRNLICLNVSVLKDIKDYLQPPVLNTNAKSVNIIKHKVYLYKYKDIKGMSHRDHSQNKSLLVNLANNPFPER